MLVEYNPQLKITYMEFGITRAAIRVKEKLNGGEIPNYHSR